MTKQKIQDAVLMHIGNTALIDNVFFLKNNVIIGVMQFVVIVARVCLLYTQFKTQNRLGVDPKMD